MNKSGPEVREGLGPCWLWTGYVGPRGYGYFWLNRKNKYVHRYAWEQANGSTDGLMLLHSCDVRNCVNVAHMSLGTNVDNMRDMVERDRACKGERKPMAKVNEAIVVEMRNLRRAGMSIADIARKFGLSSGSTSMTVHGKKWKHVPGAVTLEEELAVLPDVMLPNAARPKNRAA